MKERGDIISVDGWGPIRHQDWNGNRYYINLFLYQSPSQVKHIVVDFLKEIQTFLGNPIKIFRHDPEEGYMSKMVTEFCKSVGTRVEVSLADSHKQMGMNEGFNTHCLETVRTMLGAAQKIRI